MVRRSGARRPKISSTAIDEAARVVAFVSSQCDALLAGQVVLHHRERSLALGGPGRRRDLYFDEQPTLGRKLLSDAHASISVPSTVK
jgi:hypothetical protein